MIEKQDNRKEKERARSMMDIQKAMAERILFCDGGMGSLLQARGLKPGELPGT